MTTQDNAPEAISEDAPPEDEFSSVADRIVAAHFRITAALHDVMRTKALVSCIEHALPMTVEWGKPAYRLAVGCISDKLDDIRSMLELAAESAATDDNGERETVDPASHVVSMPLPIDSHLGQAIEEQRKLILGAASTLSAALIAYDEQDPQAFAVDVILESVRDVIDAIHNDLEPMVLVHRVVAIKTEQEAAS